MAVGCLPRRNRQREDAVERVLSSFDKEAVRTLRNFTSFEMLEEEVTSAFLRVAHDKSWTFGIGIEDPLGEMERSIEEQNLWRRVKRMKNLRICETPLTEEFRSALSLCEDERFVPLSWWKYEQFRRVRCMWGEYLRSNFDWDRDSTFFLKMMFGVDHP